MPLTRLRLALVVTSLAARGASAHAPGRRRRAAQVPPGGTHLCSLCDESFDDSLAALADDRLAP